MSRLLSIVIATYNRKEVLYELITSLLKNDSDEFDIVVTDNCSTDGTFEMLQSIKDKRLVVKRNDSPLPGLNNMIESLYNADGKYAFYCNDRDIIFQDMIPEIIRIIKSNEYSFIHFKRSGKHRIVKTKIFESGYESYMNQDYTHHPTGCCINTSCLKKLENKEKYFGYLQTQYPIDYLIRDLLLLEKSAINYTGVWKEGGFQFKKNNKSGAVVGHVNFFDPECIVYNSKQMLQQIWQYTILDDNQIRNLTSEVVYYNAKQLLFYKQYLSNKEECEHYSREPRYVSYFEMLRILKEYRNEMESFCVDNGRDYCENKLRIYSSFTYRTIIIDVRNLFRLW